MILPTETQLWRPSLPDLDLIRKYSIPGPRYTSYPPATKFSDLMPLGLDETIAADNQEPALLRVVAMRFDATLSGATRAHSRTL